MSDLGRSETSQVIRPDRGWDHVGCPTCGFVTTFPSDRLREEGAPWCVHNGGSIVFNRPEGDPHRHSSERWSQMVPALVLSVDAVLDDLTPRERNEGS